MQEAADKLLWWIGMRGRDMEVEKFGELNC